MQRKVILVLIDGLAWQVARDSLGYLLGLAEAGRASAYSLCAALPSLSRPLYECILTGAAPVDSGIVHNGVRRLSNQSSLFHLARAGGRRTAAAAYHWISELYNRSPYVARRDRHTNDDSLPIQHGMFYHCDDYPDEHLLLDADTLLRLHAPDFLLVHPMNVDDAGHRHGLDSAAYRNAARRFDALLSDYLSDWLAAGYQILVTSDHGMNADGTHGGSLPEEREVPLFVLGDGFSHHPSLTIDQTMLCGSMATLMGLAHDKPYCPELLA
ncbi:MAG: alkaline phosphatase family protein [Paludibacterium sp.]|uniref:alkaline phosphatase family protein n=1 Tax=Paludibacterium sp. TaxID=1917523 RepID=UPI0025D6521D|nr:alkaline phosphatase family protein [Paludibacterium sp.]MBV8049226.1 alkaline phosphatase family protein [Paludibacterium sp.]MBV8646609.1 alkaline phosphatase family protein [Paludibacterium sp.]